MDAPMCRVSAPRPAWPSPACRGHRRARGGTRAREPESSRHRIARHPARTRSPSFDRRPPPGVGVTGRGVGSRARRSRCRGRPGAAPGWTGARSRPRRGRRRCPGPSGGDRQPARRGAGMVRLTGARRARRRGGGCRRPAPRVDATHRGARGSHRAPGRGGAASCRRRSRDRAPWGRARAVAGGPGHGDGAGTRARGGPGAGRGLRPRARLIRVVTVRWARRRHIPGAHPGRRAG